MKIEIKNNLIVNTWEEKRTFSDSTDSTK